jgi:hypothetical protein
MTTLVISANGNSYSASATTPAVGEVGKRLEHLLKTGFSDAKQSLSASVASVYNELQALANDYGAAEFPEVSKRIAMAFLEALPADVPAPDLGLDDDGEVTFDWTGANGRMITLALRADGQLSYACRISAADKQNGTKLFVDTVPNVVVECIRQVVRR